MSEEAERENDCGQLETFSIIQAIYKNLLSAKDKQSRYSLDTYSLVRIKLSKQIPAASPWGQYGYFQLVLVHPRALETSMPNKGLLDAGDDQRGGTCAPGKALSAAVVTRHPRGEADPALSWILAGQAVLSIE